MRWTTDEFTGKRFGKYEAICRLAVGGMAEIFLGFARSGPFVGRPVVLKRILTEQREDPQALQNLIDEAKLTATLNHPNVAQVLDLDIDGDDVLLVIEFISGANLEEVVEVFRDRNELAPLGFVLSVIREAAEGLGHAHTHRTTKGELVPIIHRDVTPRNVMVDFEGATKVLDFGIARVKGAARRTQIGMVRGTTAYMSPEQAIGKELDPRSDLFSLGVVFHELLTGTRLFFKGNASQEMAAVYESEIPVPSRASRRVPKAIDPVVMKLLERKLDRRYQTATDFLNDLSSAAASMAWPKERCAELLRQQFADREKDMATLTARIPTARAVPAYPESRASFGRVLTNPFQDEEPQVRTIPATDPVPRVPRPSTPSPKPMPLPALNDELSSATDPGFPMMKGRGSEPVTDSVKAQDPGLSEVTLFGDVNDREGEKTRLITSSGVRRLVPAPEVPTEPRHDKVARRETTTQPRYLPVAAAVALGLGAVGGALIFRSMAPASAGMGRVLIQADRPADVVLDGQLLGRTPMNAVFPAGRHQLQFKEEGAPTRVVVVDVKPNVENPVDVTLDSLSALP